VVDGEAVLSCMVPIMLLEGREVTTVEGLGTIEKPGPLQQAFIELQAAQCGYCIPGMMMSAHALLRRKAQPSDEEIREALTTNLCRCGTHMRILAAIRRAGELMRAASLPGPDEGRTG
jgi:aerobic-type carbon monoxide dehydrogenase small subunit (CoxS/CutS family)